MTGAPFVEEDWYPSVQVSVVDAFTVEFADVEVTCAIDGAAEEQQFAITLTKTDVINNFIGKFNQKQYIDNCHRSKTNNRQLSYRYYR